MPTGPLSRREFIKTTAAAAAVLVPGCAGNLFNDAGLTAATAILRAGYDNALPGIMDAGLQLIPPPDVSGKRVLIKPNLVDLPRDDRPVTTHPAVIVAAAEALRRRGAAEVIVGDGSALQRDVWEIADATGLTAALAEHDLPFVDLNTSDIVRLPNAGGYTGLDHLYYARAAMEADVIVSVPKLKTHHWAGVSLGMKNMFGTLSSLAYGWPRNAFHLRGLHSGVIDFNLTRPPDYCIIDGVVGMEGDGPVRGTAIDVGVVIFGSVPSAADATGARVMGFAPERVEYLRRAAGMLGPIGESSIEQRGETIASVRKVFHVVAGQSALIL